MPGMFEIGNYEVLTMIGSGGQSAVYKAKNKDNDEIVALKILESGETQDRNIKREMRIYNKIKSKGISGITPLIDFDKDSDIPKYYVMPLRPNNLTDVLKGLDFETQVRYAMALLETLSALHSNDILHRDLNPNNILITEDGSPEIADFGIGKTTFARATATIGATGTLGTPGYAAPEQYLEDAETGKYSDVFSISICLYEIFTNGNPLGINYSFQNNKKTISGIDYDPISEINSNVSSTLDDVIKKGLSLNPGDRYRNASEMRNALIGSLFMKQETKSKPSKVTTNLSESVQSKPSKPKPSPPEPKKESPSNLVESYSKDKSSGKFISMKNKGLLAPLIGAFVVIVVGIMIFVISNTEDKTTTITVDAGSRTITVTATPDIQATAEAQATAKVIIPIAQTATAEAIISKAQATATAEEAGNIRAERTAVAERAEKERLEQIKMKETVTAQNATATALLTENNFLKNGSNKSDACELGYDPIYSYDGIQYYGENPFYKSNIKNYSEIFDNREGYISISDLYHKLHDFEMSASFELTSTKSTFGFEILERSFGSYDTYYFLIDKKNNSKSGKWYLRKYNEDTKWATLDSGSYNNLDTSIFLANKIYPNKLTLKVQGVSATAILNGQILSTFTLPITINSNRYETRFVGHMFGGENESFTFNEVTLSCP